MPKMIVKSKAEAQKRADQIESFRVELDLLDQDGVVTFETEQRSQVVAYYNITIDLFLEKWLISRSCQEQG